MNYLEIEQKFLYHYIPYEELNFRYKAVVTRKYLTTEPLVSINERLLQNGKKRYYITIKQGEFLVRNDCTTMITQENYSDIYNYIQENPIVIDIYEFDFDESHTISFKKVRDLDIQFAEIEYKDQKDYDELSPVIARMPFFAEDVTWNEEFYVKNMWNKINEKKVKENNFDIGS